jgi:anthranilate phosphoribosyltransferase
MNDCLQDYTDHISSGNHLSHDQVQEIARLLTSEDARSEDKFLFLKELALKGETDEEFSAFVSAFRSFAKDPELEEFSEQAIDLCGTGGDRSGSFNISTFVSIAVASSGVPVIKHGNRSISSKCGSADLLEALGIPMETNPQKLQASLSELNFCFLFAPHFHPTFKSLAPVRQSLAKEGIITMFNRLGPCLNPAKPAFQILGVYDPSYINQIAHCLTLNGGKAGWVVSGVIDENSNARIDELTSCGSNLVQGYGAAKSEIQSLTPDHWGEEIYPFNHLRGGDLTENLSIFRNLLEGNAPPGLLSTVLINISSALWISGKAPSIEQGMLQAKELIDSGKMMHWLKKAETFFSK